MRTLSILLLLISNIYLTQAQDTPKMTDQKVKELDQVLETLHERQLFNGTLLLAEEGKPVFEKTIGIANIETNEAIKPNASYRLASVSKQFVAMGIMVLAERGKLDYDDDIRKHLPELTYEGVTIRHLLHHTGGLTDYMDLFSEHWDTEKDFEERKIAGNADLVKLYAEKKPEIDFKPGEKYEYSNTGYVLLGSIIERASGERAHDFLYENVFQPAGMTNTRAFKANQDFGVKDRVYGFDYNEEGEPEANDHNFLNGMIGDGGIYASADDLLSWSNALNTEKIVKKETLKTAFTSGKTNDGTLTNYGFGWSMERDEAGNLTEVSHGGSWVGFRTYIVRALDSKRTYILLTNNTDNNIGRTLRIISKIWKGEPYELPKEKIEIELPVETLKQYIGVYELEPEFTLTFTVEGERLFVQATGQGKFEIFPMSENEFFLKVVDASVTFNKDEKGEVVSLTLHQGRDVEAKKVK